MSDNTYIVGAIGVAALLTAWFMVGREIEPRPNPTRRRRRRRRYARAR